MFVRAAESGSFSQAARELSLSQPAEALSPVETIAVIPWAAACSQSADSN